MLIFQQLIQRRIQQKVQRVLQNLKVQVIQRFQQTLLRARVNQLLKAKRTNKTETTTQADAGRNIRDLLDGAGVSPASIINDATTVYVDKDGNPYPDQNNVPIDAAVKIDYTWSIPEDIMPLKAGDYFDFKLPDGVTIEEAMGNIGDYGTYTIDADGTVHFVFNEKSKQNMIFMDFPL